MSGRFNIVKKGYDTDAVDRYISTLESQIDMYRDKDNAINNAIISAQKAADDIIRNAKAQSRTMREEANRQMSDIAQGALKQRQLLNDFAGEYSSLTARYLRIKDDADFDRVSDKIDALMEYINSFQDELTEDLELDKRKVDEE